MTEFGRLIPGIFTFEAEDGAGAAAPAGGEGDGETQAAVVDPGGGPSDTSSGEDEAQLPSGVDAPFKIEDLPPDQQEIARKLDRQWKAQFSRHTQETAARMVDEDVAGLIAKLDGDEGEEAMNELAARYGFEPSAPQPAAEDGETEDEFSHLDPVVAKELREARDARQKQYQQQTEADREKQIGVVRKHIDNGLQPLTEREGGISDEAKTAFGLIALNNPMRNGLPNTEVAAATIEKIEAAAVERFKASLNKSPAPAVNTGGSAVRQADRSTRASRLALGAQVAERHYQR